MSGVVTEGREKVEHSSLNPCPPKLPSVCEPAPDLQYATSEHFPPKALPVCLPVITAAPWNAPGIRVAAREERVAPTPLGPIQGGSAVTGTQGKDTHPKSLAG